MQKMLDDVAVPNRILVEGVVWSALCAAWIWGMSLGDRNGFGYFQQPANDIVWPLIIGGFVNAATFIGNAFVAIPRWLATGRWATYAAAVAGLMATNVAIQSLSQKLLIAIAEPALQSISLAALALENSYMAPFVVIFSALYRFARDWVRHLSERKTLQDTTQSLEQSLRAMREEIDALSTADAGPQFFHFNSGSEQMQIPVDAIQYIKSAGNYATIHTKGGSYLAYGALKDLIEELPQRRFARTHRSYIIGLAHIKKIKANAIHLEDVSVPIGAAYRQSFFAQWRQQ